MSGSFDAILSQLRAGKTPREAAARVGLPSDFGDAVAREATRLGLAMSSSDACGTCAPQPESLKCAGCPLAREQRARPQIS